MNNKYCCQPASFKEETATGVYFLILLGKLHFVQQF
jgi:hypothetical protein